MRVQTHKIVKLTVILFAFLSFLPSPAEAATTVSGLISTDTVWTAENSPYVVGPSFTIQSGVTLTIEQGAVVKFKVASSTYSALIVNGNLIVNGTTGNKVYFTSYSDDSVGGDTNGDGSASLPTSGQWLGIKINIGGTATMDNSVVKYAGARPAGCSYTFCYNGIDNFGTLNLSDSEISQNGWYGISQTVGTSNIQSSLISGNQMYGIGLSGGNMEVSNSKIANHSRNGIDTKNNSTLTLNNNTFENNNRDVYLSGSVLFNHSNNSSTGGNNMGFYIFGYAVPNGSVWTPDNMPYIVDSISVLAGNTLTINPGTVIKFYNGYSMIGVSGTLNVQGTKENKIYFTSSFDDTVGGDVNNGNTPAAENWRGLRILSGGTANIDNSIIRYGGSRYNCNFITCLGSINNNGGVLNISNSEITKNGMYGIYNVAGTTNIDATTISEHSRGIYLPAGNSILTVHNGSVFSNNGYGILNYSSNIVDATRNWWGDATGPKHYSLNPSGLGNQVSDGVLFSPWLNYDPMIEQQKEVPLYTQIESNYPSLENTRSWFDKPYAGGLNYDCGSTIADCGCAITSAVMISRYYDVVETQGKNVDPKEINEWLKDQTDGYFNGAVNWVAVSRYTDWKMKYEKTDKQPNNYTLLDDKLNNNQPVIAEATAIRARGGVARQHFFVIDKKMASSYGVKDPYWYNTKNLNETTNGGNYVRGYENGFDGLRIYKKGDGIAMSSMVISLGSPAELLITDPQGKKLGKNGNNASYDEISNAWYFEESIDDPSGVNPPGNHKNKIVQILEPTDGEYNLQVIGTGEGEYTINSQIYDIYGTPHSQVLTGNTAPGVTANYTLNFTPNNPENIDVQVVDTQPPVISHTSLNNQYIFNSQSFVFNFSAQDDGVGLRNISATLDGNVIENGHVLNFNTVGEHILEIKAEDYLGNISVEAVKFKVVYNFSGLLAPLDKIVDRDYIIGRTLPVKFKLTNANGQYIANTNAKLFVVNILSTGEIGQENPAISTSDANNANEFRYDVNNNQYIFNLSTNELTNGKWRMRIELNDGQSYNYIITLVD